MIKCKLCEKRQTKNPDAICSDCRLRNSYGKPVDIETIITNPVYPEYETITCASFITFINGKWIESRAITPKTVAMLKRCKPNQKVKIKGTMKLLLGTRKEQLVRQTTKRGRELDSSYLLTITFVNPV